MVPATLLYYNAFAIAERLEMRPLIAHCYLGLGKLYQHIGERERSTGSHRRHDDEQRYALLARLEETEAKTTSWRGRATSTDHDVLKKVAPTFDSGPSRHFAAPRNLVVIGA
jgi:hypothetical protein